MLTKEDIKRFDSIMNTVLERREARGFNTPDRDENKIAEILYQWEKAAAEEHAKWFECFR